MADFIMRVWLADRPGALAQVAGRIGAVGGDVINIDILERDNGRAIDELTVTLPDEKLIPLMLTKIAELDAVEVEDIRALKNDLSGPFQDPLQIAYELLLCDSKSSLTDKLLKGCVTGFSLDWAVMAEVDGQMMTLVGDRVPPQAWLEAFVNGAKTNSGEKDTVNATDDTAWTNLCGQNMILVLGRANRTFRSREKKQFGLLARIADHILSSIPLAN